GGPLVNVLGEVIGVNTAIYENAEGIGFAIPIYKAIEFVKRVEDGKDQLHPTLGIQVQNLTPELVRYFGLDNDKGVIIAGIHRKSPSYGIFQRGDIIIKIDSTPVTGVKEYTKYVSAKNVGTPLNVVFIRYGYLLSAEARIYSK
ncbi:MAG: PDZ domain-containing protein, partial [Actinomycetia bacterium]|nr:PDZ domain-containing protein [Actinomycetes bacterium]